MWFDSWSEIGRTLVSAAAIYFALVLILRVSGKRTLSKWNAFDFVVTVALGSVLATGVLSQNVEVAEAVVGIAGLVVAQFLVTWVSVRVAPFRELVKGEPVLLVLDGEYQREAMRSTRVPEEEILASLRANGIAHLNQVAALVLETNGTFSLLRETSEGPLEGASLRDVKGYEPSFTSRPADPSTEDPDTP
jgi:uncharacterized membrane protein YcaP (DUF421 family)